jgi:cytochrome c biogenesis factor
VTTLEPRANFYPGVTGGIVTPAVMTRPGGDLYLTLRNLDAETVELGLDTSPMIWLVWLGGLTTAMGGFWSLSVRRRQGVVEPEPVMADV